MQLKGKTAGLVLSGTIILLLLVILGLSGQMTPLQRHLRSGDKAFAVGKYSEALIEYELALQASPGNWDLKVRAAKTYLAQREFAEANEILAGFEGQDQARAKNIYSLLAQSQLGLAKLARETENMGSDKARVYLEAAHKYDPENAEVKQLLAQEIFYQAMRMPPETGIDRVEDALEIDPKPIYKLELASRYARQGQAGEFERIVLSFSQTELEDEQFRQALAQTLSDYVNGFYPIIGNKDRSSFADKALALLPGDYLLLTDKLRLLWTAGKSEAVKQLAADPSLTAEARQLLENYRLGLEENKFARETKVYPLHLQPIQGLRLFSTASGPLLAWVENVKPQVTRIMVFELKSGKRQELIRVDGTVNSFAVGWNKEVAYSLSKFSPTGENGGVYLRNSQGTKVLEQSSNARGVVYTNLFPSPDGKSAVYFDGSSFAVVELATGKKTRAGSQNTNFTAWAPDSTRFMAEIWEEPKQQGEGPKRTQVIYNLQGRELERKPLEESLSVVGWRPDGKIMYVQLEFFENLRPTYRYLVGDEPDSMLQPVLDEGYSGLFQAISNWSADSKYAMYLGRTPNELWLSSGNIPFPIIFQGQFIGWSGKNKMLFATSRTIEQNGHFLEGPTKIDKIIEVTIAD